MISVPLSPRTEVERRLGALNCKPVKGGRLETGELWVTDKGKYFIVPCEGPDRRCDTWTLDAIEHWLRQTTDC